jgi:hypothetical protein
MYIAFGIILGLLNIHGDLETLFLSSGRRHTLEYTSYDAESIR